MMRRRWGAVFLWPYLISVFGHNSGEAGVLEQHPWEELYIKNGITVLRKVVSESSLWAFRGRGIIKVKTPYVLGTLRRVDLFIEWAPGLVGKKIIKEISAVEAIHYNHNYVSWPASNREFIIHSILKVDGPFLVVESKSHPMPELAVAPGTVRGQIYFSTMKISGHDEGTFVDLNVHLDPKGYIPTQLVNLIAEKWPYEFLKALEKRALQDQITPHQDILELYQQAEANRQQSERNGF